MSPSTPDADSNGDPGTPDESGTPEGSGGSGRLDGSATTDVPDADARTAGVVAVALLGVAFAGAATAGVLPAVGPYLVCVSALVAALFLLEIR